MRLKHIVSNTERRFKTVESAPGKESIISQSIGVLKAGVRGGIVGAILGSSIFNGDEKYIIGGAILGAGADIYQDLKRLLGLKSIYKNDPVKYESLKDIYRRGNLID